MFFDDLADVFYSADAGAEAFTVAGTAPPVQFFAHEGEADAEMFDAQIMGTVRQLQFARAAAPGLSAGSQIVRTADASLWRIHAGPHRINDGAEVRALIVPA